MKKKTRQKETRQAMPDNTMMAILVDCYGGYVLPSSCCWQMLSWKKKKPATGINKPIPMFSRKK